jgi:hypothetical protein
MAASEQARQEFSGSRVLQQIELLCLQSADWPLFCPKSPKVAALAAGNPCEEGQ